MRDPLAGQPFLLRFRDALLLLLGIALIVIGAMHDEVYRLLLGLGLAGIPVGLYFDRLWTPALQKPLEKPSVELAARLASDEQLLERMTGRFDEDPRRRAAAYEAMLEMTWRREVDLGIIEPNGATLALHGRDPHDEIGGGVPRPWQGAALRYADRVNDIQVFEEAVAAPIKVGPGGGAGATLILVGGAGTLPAVAPEPKTEPFWGIS